MTSQWKTWGIALGLAACSSRPAPPPPPPEQPPERWPPPVEEPDAGVSAHAVSVTVTLDGVPQGGVPVYFQSTQLGSVPPVLTDDAGFATGDVELHPYDSTSVTVVNPFGPPDVQTDELFVYGSVRPGDHLEVTRDRRAPASARVTVSAPTDAAAASYALHTTCGEAPLAVANDGVHATGSATLVGCGGSADVLVEARDGNGDTLGALYQPGVAIADGATIALDGAYQPAATRTLHYDTQSVRAPELAIHARLRTARGVIFDRPITLAISYMDDHPSIGVALPVVPDALAIVETAYETGTAGYEHTVDWGPSRTSYELDLEPFGSYLPTFESRPELLGGGLAFTYSGGAVRANYVRFTATIARPGGRGWRWQFISPVTNAGGAEWLPILPDGVATLRAGDVVTVDAVTMAYAPGGYDAIRARATALDLPLDQLTGASGRIVYETLRPSPSATRW